MKMEVSLDFGERIKVKTNKIIYIITTLFVYDISAKENCKNCHVDLENQNIIQDFKVTKTSCDTIINSVSKFIMDTIQDTRND